jgi:hypothetical protein
MFSIDQSSIESTSQCNSNRALRVCLSVRFKDLKLHLTLKKST